MAISMPSGWPRAASTNPMSEREPSWLRSTLERAFSERSGPVFDEAPFASDRALPNRSINRLICPRRATELSFEKAFDIGS